MSLRLLHRATAFAIAMFAVVHLANHFVSLRSIASHIAFMNAARSVYRHPIIEAVLLTSVVVQIGSGLRLLFRRSGSRKGRMASLQAWSGSYLAFFLLVHVTAVLFGRAVLEVDTNFYFAAAGLHVWPYAGFFAPYYFLAVVALFVHLACAAHRHVRTRPAVVRALVVVAPAVVGTAAAALIVFSLAGVIRPVEIPAQYLTPYFAAGLQAPR